MAFDCCKVLHKYSHPNVPTWGEFQKRWVHGVKNSVQPNLGENAISLAKVQRQ
jgi:hypothetical protein